MGLVGGGEHGCVAAVQEQGAGPTPRLARVERLRRKAQARVRRRRPGGRIGDLEEVRHWLCAFTGREPQIGEIVAKSRNLHEHVAQEDGARSSSSWLRAGNGGLKLGELIAYIGGPRLALVCDRVHGGSQAREIPLLGGDPAEFELRSEVVGLDREDLLDQLLEACVTARITLTFYLGGELV